jgi:predicted aspartyl protease
MRLRSTLFSSLLLAATSPAAILAQTPSSPAPQAPRVCTIDRTKPTDGDLALAREDYDAALALYRAALLKDPTAADAHLGLVRALIGKNQTSDAIAAAQAELSKDPKSAIAEVAAGEAAFRNADFVAAHEHGKAAMQDNLCEARALALLADISSLSALFATENRLLSMAHRLRPNDEFIRRDWIGSLPRTQRKAELGDYLSDHPSLSAKDLNDYTNEEQYLKARRPGECHVTTNGDNVRIPFVPVNGDSMHPQSYGLEVSLNGKNRRMQIDSGASGIVLTPGAARRLGITPEYRLNVSGVGDDGDAKGYLAHVASIRIGNVEIADCLVTVLQKSDLDVDGLIGVDVFNHYLVTLDYQNAELRLNPLPPRVAATQNPPSLEVHSTAAPNNAAADTAADTDDDDKPPQDAVTPPQMQDWLHVARIDHELLLPSILNDGRLHYLMADTGAAESILSLSLAREAGKPRGDSNMQFKGISGDVKKVYHIDDAVLQFGHLRLPKATYPVFDLTNISHDSGVEISGFVGLPTLSRLTISIDYRDNLMQLKYDPKHDKQRFF